MTGEGTDLAIVTFGNGHLPVAAGAAAAGGGGDQGADRSTCAGCRPCPKAALTAAVQGCTHMLIVDETRHSGGVAEALMAHFHETRPGCRWRGSPREDSFIATGPAYAATMPSADGIVAAALALLEGRA